MIRSGDETETVSLPDIAPMLASIKIGDDVDAGDLLDTIAEEAGAEADAPAEASGATVNPLWDMSTFQAPALTCNTAGGSGAWGATYGNVRSGCTSSHGGWDIFARIGTPVRAVTDGTVTHQQQAGGGGWGHYLLLDPADENSDLSFRYAHLTNIEIGNVGHSWDVEAGEIIGYTGVTGNACEAAPHLHFEVLDNGAGTDPDDYFDMPTQYRKFDKDLTLQMPDNPCD